MEESQNSDQMVKASEVDNVCHAERDYFVKAWIECQFTGLYTHGLGLRHYFQVFTVLHCGLRVERVGANLWITKCISNSLHTESDFFLYTACVLFDCMDPFIIKSSFTGV